MQGSSTMQSYLGARYDAAARHGHVESYFLKANDPKSRRALWLKATIYASDRHPDVGLAEAWAIAFDGDRGEHVAVKTTVPFDRARFGKNALDVAIDGATLSPGKAKGKIETGTRSIAYDLRFDAFGVPLVHYPHAWMYERAFPKFKLVSPLPDLRLSGEVVVNGETWVLDAWPGLLGHNWGPAHSLFYGWGHCNVWDDPREDLVLEGASSRLKLGPVTTPLLTILCIRYRGVRYDINALADVARSSGRVSPRRWSFRGKNALCAIDGELWGETDDFVGLYYADSDGSVAHCLNTKIAHARVTLTVRGRAPVSLQSRAAALEILTRDPQHGVRMYV